MRLVLAFAAALLSGQALADVTVEFREGAPTDRFTIRNEGACALGAARVTIDLSGSPAGLVFDTTASGAGVQVFQPFSVVEGEGSLAALPALRDGDREVSLQIGQLGPGEAIAFTTDVDDTQGTRAITVSDGELAGASATLSVDGRRATATFGERPSVRLTRACG